MIYAELTSSDIGGLAPSSVALVPLAATEQHGPHLPVATDTAIVTEIARRVEEALPDRVMLLPALWIGSSHHHLGFPGTLTVASELYILLVMDLVKSLHASGFERIFLLNGHGGNQVPAHEALGRLNQAFAPEHEPWVAFASYWKLAEKQLAEQTFTKTPTLTHACEFETSMMLAIRPEGVKARLAKGACRPSFSRYYDPLGGGGSSRVVVAKRFSQVTANGAMGKPELASRETGEKLLALISAAVTDFVEEFTGWPREIPRSCQ